MSLGTAQEASANQLLLNRVKSAANCTILHAICSICANVLPLGLVGTNVLLCKH